MIVRCLIFILGFCVSFNESEAQFQIKGVVTEYKSGLPLQGVTISSFNENLDTLSDAKGHYLINVSTEEKNILQFSLEGYIPETRNAGFREKDSVISIINVTLVPLYIRISDLIFIYD